MFPFIALGTAIAGGAINYFGEMDRQKQAEEEMERRRADLEDAKFTGDEMLQGKARIQRQHGAAADSAMNKFAFTSRGVQANQAQGAMVGEMQGAMLSDVNQYISSAEQYNKQIEREQAQTGVVPQTSGLLAAGAGALAGLQTGMVAERFAGDMGWFDSGPDMPSISKVTPTQEIMAETPVIESEMATIGRDQSATDLADTFVFNEYADTSTGKVLSSVDSEIAMAQGEGMQSMTNVDVGQFDMNVGGQYGTNLNEFTSPLQLPESRSSISNTVNQASMSPSFEKGTLDTSFDNTQNPVMRDLESIWDATTNWWDKRTAAPIRRR